MAVAAGWSAVAEAYGVPAPQRPSLLVAGQADYFLAVPAKRRAANSPVPRWADVLAAVLPPVVLQEQTATVERMAQALTEARSVAEAPERSEAGAHTMLK